MNRQLQRWDMRIQEQRRVDSFREMVKIEDAYYDGVAFYAEYSKAIANLLKDPVSLALADGNGDRELHR